MQSYLINYDGCRRLISSLIYYQGFKCTIKSKRSKESGKIIRYRKHYPWSLEKFHEESKQGSNETLT